jgi:hypothetical protein
MGLVLSIAAGIMFLVASSPRPPAFRPAPSAEPPPFTPEAYETARVLAPSSTAPSSLITPTLSERSPALATTYFWHCMLTNSVAITVKAELREVEPARSYPGGEVTVKGTGGYHYIGGCGAGPERGHSQPIFPLYFDGQPAEAEVNCQDICMARLRVPAGAAPGLHAISVEANNQILMLEVLEPIPLPPSPASMETPAPIVAPVN